MRPILIMLSFVFLIACQDQSMPPTADLLVFPSKGDSSILFELNSSGSFDENFHPVTLLYRWDFNGDMEWDTEFSEEPVFVRRFNQPGVFSISVQVMNPDCHFSIATDTIEVFGRNRDISILVDPRDNQSYRIVKLNGRWWMAESLRYGIEVNPLVQDMSNNQIVERFVYKTLTQKGIMSFYSWYEALNYNLSDQIGICPHGWHIPSRKEWQLLYFNYPTTYIAKYLGKNGLSELNLQNGGHLLIDYIDRNIICDSLLSTFWSSENFFDASNSLQMGSFNYRDSISLKFSFLDQKQFESPFQYKVLTSVRCIKD